MTINTDHESDSLNISGTELSVNVPINSSNLKKNNWAASIAPTVNNDTTQGYEVGSRWINLATDKEWVCTDNTTATAVWTDTTATSTGDNSSVTSIVMDIDSDNDSTLETFTIRTDSLTELFKITETGAVTFANAFTFPVVDGTLNYILKTDGVGTVTWSNSISGFTINNTVIGGTTPLAGTFTVLNANGGGALTGTWTDLGTVTTIIINGGTINGVVIGGTTPLAGTFTSLTSTGISDNATSTSITINSSQDVGIGIATLDAWASSLSALQIGGTGNIVNTLTAGAGNELNILQNAYFDVGWKYQVTDQTSRIKFIDGTIVSMVAASGTVDTAITWTTAMTIANDGKVSFNVQEYNPKPGVKDWGTLGINTAITLQDAEVHIIDCSAAITLTISSSFTNDKATLVIKNGNFVISLAGIDNDSPTLTQAASTQDFVGVIKSFGKISAVATTLNKATV